MNTVNHKGAPIAALVSQTCVLHNYTVSLQICNTKVCRKTRCAHFGYKQMQRATMMSPGVYNYNDVWKWGNRLTLVFNVIKNTDYMKKSLK